MQYLGNKTTLLSEEEQALAQTSRMTHNKPNQTLYPPTVQSLEALSLLSVHYEAQFMRGGDLRGKAQQMWVSPRREMETLT